MTRSILIQYCFKVVFMLENKQMKALQLLLPCHCYDYLNEGLPAPLFVVSILSTKWSFTDGFHLTIFLDPPLNCCWKIFDILQEKLETKPSLFLNDLQNTVYHRKSNTIAITNEKKRDCNYICDKQDKIVVITRCEDIVLCHIWKGSLQYLWIEYWRLYQKVTSNTFHIRKWRNRSDYIYVKWIINSIRFQK